MIKNKFIYLCFSLSLVSCTTIFSNSSTRLHDTEQEIQKPLVVINHIEKRKNSSSCKTDSGLVLSAMKIKSQGTIDFRATNLACIKLTISNDTQKKFPISIEQFYGMVGNIEVMPLSKYDTYKQLYASYVKASAYNSATKGALWGAIGGALIGAAIAIIYDVNPSAITKTGALSGAVGGYATSYNKAIHELDKALEKELGTGYLKETNLLPGAKRKGVIFFPTGTDKLIYNNGDSKYEINL